MDVAWLRDTLKSDPNFHRITSTGKTKAGKIHEACYETIIPHLALLGPWRKYTYNPVSIIFEMYSARGNESDRSLPSNQTINGWISSTTNALVFLYFSFYSPLSLFLSLSLPLSLCLSLSVLFLLFFFVFLGGWWKERTIQFGREDKNGRTCERSHVMA